MHFLSLRFVQVLRSNLELTIFSLRILVLVGSFRFPSTQYHFQFNGFEFLDCLK